MESRPDQIWEQWRAKGDPLDRERVITHYLPLVQRVTGRIVSTLPSHIAFEDLYSVGIAGLIKAVDQYDPSKRAKFESYAILLVRGAIIDELRRQNWAPRTVYQQAARLADVQRDLEVELGRPAGDDEVAQRLGITPEAFGEMLERVRPSLFIPLHARGESSGSLAERIPDGKAVTGAEAAVRKERRQLLEERIGRLPEQERKVLTLYYYDELMLREIGELLGVSESRVSQIHTKALLHLRLLIGESREEFHAD